MRIPNTRLPDMFTRPGSDSSQGFRSARATCSRDLQVTRRFREPECFRDTLLFRSAEISEVPELFKHRYRNIVVCLWEFDVILDILYMASGHITRSHPKISVTRKIEYPVQARTNASPARPKFFEYSHWPPHIPSFIS